jgi:hypothetical protein
MAVCPDNSGFGKMMVDVLGLPKNTRSFELRMAVDEVVSVKCEYFPEILKDELATVFFEYDLVKKDARY